MRPAVFLDRDGTIIEERGYLDRLDLLELYSFTADAIRLLNRAGFATVVVTNQGGIGRGIIDEPFLHHVHQKLDARLDPQLFAFRVEQARAEVDVASDALRIAKDEVAIAETVANRAIAESSKAEAEAQRSDVIADNAWRRVERKLLLMKSGSTPVSDLDDARAAYLHVHFAAAGCYAAKVERA